MVFLWFSYGFPMVFYRGMGKVMVEDRGIFEAYVDFRAMHRWASSSEPRSAELGPIAAVPQ